MNTLDIGFVVDSIGGILVESIKDNLGKSETVVRVLKRLGMAERPSSSDFDAIFVYALVDYGLYKPAAILNVFRSPTLREGFREAFYSGEHEKLDREVDTILDINRDTGEFGSIGYRLREEVDELWQTFMRVVNATRTPAQVQDTLKLDQLHGLVLEIQGQVNLLATESTAAQQIAKNRPDLWEYLLTLELLRTKLAPVKREFANLERGLVYRPGTVVTDTLSWLRKKTSDLSNLILYLRLVVTEELPSAWGKLNEPGDVAMIQYAVDKYAEGCQGLLEWETDLRFATIDDQYQALRQLLAGWAAPYLVEIEKVPKFIGEVIGTPGASGTYRIDLVFEPPANVREVEQELERLQAARGVQ